MLTIVVLTPGAGRWTAPAAQSGRGQPFAIPPADAGERVETRNGVVTSANALASEAGIEILRAGGIDSRGVICMIHTYGAHTT